MKEETGIFSFFHIYSHALGGNYSLLFHAIGTIIFVVLLNFVINIFLKKMHARYEKQNNIWVTSLLTGIKRPLTYFLRFVAINYSLDMFLSRIFLYDFANLSTVFSVGAILCAGWSLLRSNRAVMQNMIQESRMNHINMAPSQVALMGKLISIAVICLTMSLLLELTGCSMQTLITFGGIGGLALAFASQQMISNFFGGLMIYVTQPFTIGEWVNLPERKIEGHIEEIGWYLTCIRNFEKRPIYVPNSVFTQTIVITPSRMTHERFHHTIGLRPQDIRLIPVIVEKIKLMLQNYSDVDKNMKMDVFFMNLGTTSIDIEISAYIPKVFDKRRTFTSIQQDLLLKIADIIMHEGAEVATAIQKFEIRTDLLPVHQS